MPSPPSAFATRNARTSPIVAPAGNLAVSWEPSGSWILAATPSFTRASSSARFFSAAREASASTRFFSASASRLARSSIAAARLSAASDLILAAISALAAAISASAFALAKIASASSDAEAFWGSS